VGERGNWFWEKKAKTVGPQTKVRPRSPLREEIRHSQKRKKKRHREKKARRKRLRKRTEGKCLHNGRSKTEKSREDKVGA